MSTAILMIILIADVAFIPPVVGAHPVVNAVLGVVVDYLWGEIQDILREEESPPDNSNYNKKVDDLVEKFINVEQTFHQTIETVRKDFVKFMDHVFKNFRTELLYEKLRERVSFIENQYDEFIIIINETTWRKRNQTMRHNPSTVLNFAEAIVEDDAHSVKMMIWQIEEILTGLPIGFEMPDHSFLELISNYLEVSCLPKSNREAIHDFYNIIQMTLWKGYAMVGYSYMIKQFFGQGDFHHEMETFQLKFENRNLKSREVFLNILDEANSYYFRDPRCEEPKEHIEGVTYLQITKFMQGVFHTEQNPIEEFKALNTCPEGSTFIKDENYKKMEMKNMRACPSNESIRLFDYVRSDKFEFGSEKECKKPEIIGGKSTTVSFGYCTVWKSPQQDRYINLRPMFSDTHKNMVVTGVRFVKVKQIIHLQLQEGHLMAGGLINQTTLSWIPVEDYSLEKATEGVDYHALNVSTREIELEDIFVPEGYVVTGFRFMTVGNNRRLKLSVRASKILDPMTGELEVPRLNVLLNNAKLNSIGLNYSTSDVPTKSSENVLIPTNDHYLLFNPSDKFKDVSQTVIPFFDAQEVAPEPAVPLNGIGLFLKGAEGFEGFLTPRISASKYAYFYERNKTSLSHSAIKWNE